MSTTQTRRAVTEETHLAAEAAIKSFSYKTPEKMTRAKANTMLVKGNLVRAMVQVVREGGENNLHYHAKVDGFWFVLKGKARFYGPSDELLAECEPQEGIVIPQYARYWFEKAGDEDLEILLVQAFDEGGQSESGRTDSEPKKLTDEDIDHFALAGAKS